MCFMAQSSFYCFTSTQFNNWQLFYERRCRTSPCTSTQSPTYTFISFTISFSRTQNISGVQNKCPDLHHFKNARQEQDLKRICSINPAWRRFNSRLTQKPDWRLTHVCSQHVCSQQLHGFSRSTRERISSLTIYNTQPSQESLFQPSWVSHHLRILGMTPADPNGRTHKVSHTLLVNTISWTSDHCRTFHTCSAPQTASKHSLVFTISVLF